MSETDISVMSKASTNCSKMTEEGECVAHPQAVHQTEYPGNEVVSVFQSLQAQSLSTATVFLPVPPLHVHIRMYVAQGQIVASFPGNALERGLLLQQSPQNQLSAASKFTEG